ncbi:MAG: nucleoside monophosphate kinase [bacterium]
MESKPRVFIFIGRSGCGKGTQADLIMKHLCEHDKSCKTVHVETGALLREFRKGETLTQKKCAEIMEAGGLMPEFLVVGLWSEYLMKNIEGGENVVFDGCPRKLHEAMTLDSTLKFYNWGKPDVLLMNVSREWSKARMMARKRPDDNEEDIEARLNWFDTDVQPAVDYYRNNPNYNFHDINGEQTIEQVFTEIQSKTNI